MANQIALYSAGFSPFVLRVEIALEEVGVKAVRHVIDPSLPKPAWYTEKINPLGQFPAITYGPPHPKDQPAPTSVKLNESLVIVGLLAELYPDASTILPKDPVQRAKARFFAALIDSVVLPALISTVFTATEGMSTLYKAFDTVQAQLPDGTRYAIGDDFTIADIAAAPILGMLEVILSNDLGKYEPGEGLKAYEIYNSAKYDKLRGYVKRILGRESAKKCIINEKVKDNFVQKFPRSS